MVITHFEILIQVGINIGKRKLRPTKGNNCKLCSVFFRYKCLYSKLRPIEILFYNSYMALPRRHHEESTIAVLQKCFFFYLLEISK
jgi:hypothetical protein